MGRYKISAMVAVSRVCVQDVNVVRSLWFLVGAIVVDLCYNLRKMKMMRKEKKICGGAFVVSFKDISAH